jgi:hypothetical protein
MSGTSPLMRSQFQPFNRFAPFKTFYERTPTTLCPATIAGLKQLRWALAFVETVKNELGVKASHRVKGKGDRLLFQVAEC